MKYLLIFLLFLVAGNCLGQKTDSVVTKVIGSGHSLWPTPGNHQSTLTITSRQDTIKILMLVCDTSEWVTTGVSWRDSTILNKSQTKWHNNSTWWQFGYEVRLVDSVMVDVSINPNVIREDGSSTLLGWMPEYKNIATYTHKEYIDQTKKPLKSNIVVWLTRENQ